MLVVKDNDNDDKNDDVWRIPNIRMYYVCMLHYDAKDNEENSNPNLITLL